MKAKDEDAEKCKKIKTLYIKFDFDDWIEIAKKALHEQKTRSDVIIEIIKDYFINQK